MSEKRVLSIVNKTLLKNVIRHTDSHNKVVEENEMWRQRQKESERLDPTSTRNSFLKDRGVDMRYEFSTNRERRAHMDDEPRSTYWMNELYKAEEADDNRWGHSGFKELYPEKFGSGATEKRNKTDRSFDRYDRRLNTHYNRRDSSDRDSSSSDDSDRDRKHRRKRKHKSKKRNSEKRKYSDSDSSIDTDSDMEREKKKKRKKHRKSSGDNSSIDSDTEMEREKKKRKKKHKSKDKKKRKKRKRKDSSES